MQIPYTPGQDYYTPFYLLATLTNVLLLLWEGRRRGFPLRPWLTMVAASSLALIIGTKLVTHPVGAWFTLLFANAPADTARSILGGGLAAVLAVLVLRRWLGLSWAVLDALALPLCAALVVQCVGCVLTGCCFGEPTAAPWGLTYAAGTPPWWAQVQAGLLPCTAPQSLPVVPTQLLALLLCAAVGGVLLVTRHRRWPVGSWLLLQTGLLLLGRFGQVFWRDAASEPVAGATHTGPGGPWLELQLWLLPLALLALGIWSWRVRRHEAAGGTAAAPATPAPDSSRSLLVVLSMLALTAVLGPQVLTLPEVLVVRALLLAVLVAEAGARLATLHRWAPRLAGMPLVGLLAGVLVFGTAQQTPPATAEDANSQASRTTIVTGGVLGNYHESEQSILSSNSGCGGSQRLALQQQVYAAGGEIAMEKAEPAGNTTTWGGGLWVGQQNIDAQTVPIPNGSTPILGQPESFKEVLVDAHIYREVHRQHSWFNLDSRVGLHVGSLGYFSYFGSGETRKSTPIIPEFMTRMSLPSGVLFGQADLCYGAENALGSYTTRYGLGSNLGLSTGTSVLVGYANSPHQPSPSLGFVSAQLRLPGRTGLVLEPYYATDLGRHNKFSIKLNYRIGH
ncbi:prolipoprotein diacylglyceryl transferase family protein [Hymenobacter properus]|uniref:Prolipoprotein diacylglyceryl transferase n=1 Tax=Hymenobacter properus TaxID=2791026 RepID=A0A931FQ25_9BACT|nr:prolipoprotein diacylglyceryl transferase family protein [Hymenobacter properus]MBF9144179.1 prolipoprotein diacylglyceryl transferase [Hymenobacter properus]MBR7722996.1 prolipoprotein diacylglyceryl transferase [Microvirga sp. SRT04]